MIPARDNPFASCRVESLRYRFPGFDFDQQVSRLAEMGWRAEILGPHGTGKTTLLIELHRYLTSSWPDRACRFWFVPREATNQRAQWLRLCEECSADEILLIDGIERLSWLRRAQLVGRLPISLARGSRFPSSIVITTHRSMGLPLWIRSQTTKALLNELLLELNPQADREMMQQAERIFTTHQGNIREVFWQLYDRIS